MTKKNQSNWLFTTGFICIGVGAFIIHPAWLLVFLGFALLRLSFELDQEIVNEFDFRGQKPL